MPAANIPNTLRTKTSLLQDAVDSLSLVIDPPHIVTAAGVALVDHPSLVLRMLQNVGTTVVLVQIDETANPTALAYHFSLAAGTAVDDGLGGVIDLSLIRGTVRVAGVGQGVLRVATFQARREL